MLLDRAAEGLGSADADPDVRASLLAAVGGAYSRLGLFRDALPFFREAEELLASRPPGDAERVHVLERIGAASQSLRDLDGARAAWSAAVAGHRARLAASPGDPALETDLADALASLAFAGGADGSEESREHAAREAIALLEGHADPDAGILAGARRTLADVLDGRSQREEAEALYRAVIADLETLGPELAADLASARTSLGILLMRDGRAREALPLFEQALAAFDEVLGPTHPVTLSMFANVVSAGAAVEPAARIGAAREWVRRERTAVETRPDRLVSALRQLALHARAAGNLQEARDAAEEAVALADARRLSGSPASFLARVELGHVLHAAGDMLTAAATLQAALAPGAVPQGTSPAAVAGAYSLHADVLEGLGRTEEASAQRAEAMRIRPAAGRGRGAGG
jgi:tetratricopeptide (TPR) repeat protein